MNIRRAISLLCLSLAVFISGRCQELTFMGISLDMPIDRICYQLELIGFEPLGIDKEGSHRFKGDFWQFRDCEIRVTGKAGTKVVVSPDPWTPYTKILDLVKALKAKYGPYARERSTESISAKEWDVGEYSIDFLEISIFEPIYSLSYNSREATEFSRNYDKEHYQDRSNEDRSNKDHSDDL